MTDAPQAQPSRVSAPCEQHRFRDISLSDDERLDALVSSLTLSEKIKCLGTDDSVERLGVRGARHVEGLHGLAVGGPGSWGRDDPVPTTTFPQAIGLAQTWDPDAMTRVAERQALEARYVFQHPDLERAGLIVRAPNADIGRDPRWGRTEECYGEDPYLCSVMAAAFVRGLQGPDPKHWKTASLLKHFLANSNENERSSSSSDFGERALHEYYAPAFRVAITEAGASCFMAAYNAYNGVPCHTHPILRELTMEIWGLDGVIATDGGGMRLLFEAHQATPDLPCAAASCVKAGITQFLDKFQEPVEEAVARGLLTEDDIDQAIRRNFRVMLRLGLLDPPGADPYAGIGRDGSPPPWEQPEARKLVRSITARSMVLLKNDGLLPLERSRLKRVALIGPLADRVLTDWYSGTPPYLVSPTEGLLRELDREIDLVTVSNNDLSAAVYAARRADVCIVCVGNHPTGDRGWAKVSRPEQGREAVDRESLDLEDESWIEKVFAVNPNTVVVLVSSFPYAINWTVDSVPAIVHVTHNSQELGNALADVLFGRVNPAGRLVQTWPASLEQLPRMLDYEVEHGRTYRYSEHEPLFPFGYGLSYTRFEYGKPALSRQTLARGERARLELEVSNVGERAGDEVVQVYAEFPGSGVTRPKRQLVGFRRVFVEAGATSRVTIELEAKSFEHWDTSTQGFALERTRVQLRVGASSTDLRQSIPFEIGAEAS